MPKESYSILLKDELTDPIEVFNSEPYMVCRYLYKGEHFFVVYHSKKSGVVCSIVEKGKVVSCKDYVYDITAMRFIDERTLELHELEEYIITSIK